VHNQYPNDIQVATVTEEGTRNIHVSSTGVYLMEIATQKTREIVRYYSFIRMAGAECDDSLPFSGASSIPLCYVLFPTILLHQLFFHPLSPHLAFYFLVYLSTLLFPNSYIIPFWEFDFIPFSVHVQTNVILARYYEKN